MTEDGAAPVPPRGGDAGAAPSLDAGGAIAAYPNAVPLGPDGGNEALVAALGPDARMLFAYGLMGEVFAALRPLGVDYMGAQADWLRGLGATVEVVRLPTGAAVADNAARLRARLLAEPAPVVVVAHSKGGLESLAALLDPEAAARCRAFVALQSPFFGSPLADAVVAAPPLRMAAGGALRLLRGAPAGVLDLTTATRADWMRGHAAEVAALVAARPVLCCATFLDEANAAGPDRVALPLVRWMTRHGAGPNDGLVPVASALLPGARQVVVPGVMHRASVSRGRGRDPVGLMRRLLLSALRDEEG